MTNLEKYNLAFTELFNLADSSSLNNLTYQSIPNWDSVGHMELIARLEDDFKISIEMDDVIDFNSYAKGMELISKYGIVI